MPAVQTLVNDAKSIKVKTFLLILFLVWLLGWLFTYTFRDTYHFQKISERSIHIQKQSLDDFLEIFRIYNIPLILFDIEILPNLFQARPKSWHSSVHKCKTLCKYHPEEKNVVTFAIRARTFEGKEDSVIKDLEHKKYIIHLSLDIDPRLAKQGREDSYIPTYLWIAKNDHVIHVAFLHERLSSYYWIGPVRQDDWRDTVNVLAPALSNGWQSMEKIGAKFPVHAQAFDFSQRFLGLPLEIDGHKVNVPYFITKFMDEYQQSHFIECDYKRAHMFKHVYVHDLSTKEQSFMISAKQVIYKTKIILDDIKVSFWLSGGTFLGWYRQCDIIPYSVNVDFGIFIQDFSLKIIEKMHDGGFSLLHKYGKADDGLELSFVSSENVKVNLLFFYNESDYVWNGGTHAENGQKYKYRYPKFDICWTEFLDMKVKIPCNSKEWIETHYGPNWRLPLKDWQRKVHPPNMKLNGKWKESDRDVAIQNFLRIDEQNNAVTIIQQGSRIDIDLPEELDSHINNFKEKP